MWLWAGGAGILISVEGVGGVSEEGCVESLGQNAWRVAIGQGFSSNRKMQAVHMSADTGRWDVIRGLGKGYNEVLVEVLLISAGVHGACGLGEFICN